MESTSQLIRCQPFSDYPTESQQTCCSKMNLLPVVNNPLHCKTCHIRKIVPKGVAPIFPANYCADKHRLFQIIIPLSAYYVPRLHFKQFGQNNLSIHMSLSAYKRLPLVYQDHMFAQAATKHYGSSKGCQYTTYFQSTKRYTFYLTTL